MNTKSVIARRTANVQDNLDGANRRLEQLELSRRQARKDGHEEVVAYYDMSIKDVEGEIARYKARLEALFLESLEHATAGHEEPAKSTTPVTHAAAYAWLGAYESQLEECDQLDDIATTAFAHIVTAGSGLDERLVQLAVQDMADDTLAACRPPVAMTKAEVRDCAGFTPFVLHQAALLRGALKAFFEEHAALADAEDDELAAA